MLTDAGAACSCGDQAESSRGRELQGNGSALPHTEDWQAVSGGAAAAGDTLQRTRRVVLAAQNGQDSSRSAAISQEPL